MTLKVNLMKQEKKTCPCEAVVQHGGSGRTEHRHCFSADYQMIELYLLSAIMSSIKLLEKGKPELALNIK